MNHHFTNLSIRCRCIWCGRDRHCAVDCGATNEVRAAIANYARLNGRNWKRKLYEAWMEGTELDQALQLARHVVGGIRLRRITGKILAEVGKE